jgi:hypothetical protein
MTKETASELRKIVLRLPSESWHGHATETIWAEDLGKGQFRVRSVPFFANGLSAEDIVRVQDEDGFPVVVGVDIHSGHSTYRLFLRDGLDIDDIAFLQHWKKLERLGCSFERATQRLFGVDVPPQAEISAVYRLFEEGEVAGVWDFEEGHCGHV